ncbi:MAG: response regulator transcription factor [Candidatus Omnitrophota bacterium]
MAKKILIVDDEPFVVKVLANRLEASNYEVISAYDGQEGLKKVHDEKPDLIILDLILPKINGYEICNMLKKDKTFSEIPIIIISGRTTREDMKLAEEAAADAYIIKPFDRETLLSKIEELLEGG